MITPGQLLDSFTSVVLKEFGDAAKVWFIVKTDGVQTHVQVLKDGMKYAVERHFTITELEYYNVPAIYFVEKVVKTLKEEMKKGEADGRA